MSRLVEKPTICIGENKGADQLRGNREADQRLCFRYSDSTIPLLLKSEISSFYLFSVLVQAGLCRTCSETTLLVFPRGGSYAYVWAGFLRQNHRTRFNLICIFSTMFITALEHRGSALQMVPHSQLLLNAHISCRLKMALFYRQTTGDCWTRFLKGCV